jgi:TctA family transporter
MITAIIGWIYAVLFILLASVIVSVLTPYLGKNKMTYEKRVVVEGILWGLSSMVVLILNLNYFLLNSFAYAVLLINGMKIFVLPLLDRLKHSNRRKYLVLKRLMRKF